MPPQKRISSLLDLSLASIRGMVCAEALRVARVAVTSFVYDELVAQNDVENDEQTSKAAWEREVYLSDQIELFKQHLLGHIPHTLMEKALVLVMEGIHDATRVKKKGYTPTTSMSRFTREMYAIVKFSTILVQKDRRVLNLDDVPKIIRTKLYQKLKHFENLRVLVLGSGSGGWVTDAYNEYFILGIPKMRHLVKFSLMYDCTENVLQVLSETCSRTLKILDVERSQQVKDAAVPYILELEHLEDLNVFGTGLAVESKAKLLVGLKNLLHLRRGDFLCDAIEYLADNHQTLNLRLKLQDFWASEEYWFHTSEQMALVGEHCPDIRHIMFMYQSEVCQLSYLAAFEHLETLDIWGGSFYIDGFIELLEVIGHGLKTLHLVHVDEMDKRAIAAITIFCPNLVKFGLINCEFTEIRGAVDEQGWEIRAENIEASPLLDLEVIKIVTECNEEYVSFILELCLNVKEINIGMNTGVTDETICSLLRDGKNSLQHLETFTIQATDKVTMAAVKMLLLHCDKLSSIKQLTAFKMVHPMELAMLRAELRGGNLVVDTGEEEEARFERVREDSSFGTLKAQEIANAFSELSITSGSGLGLDEGWLQEGW